MVWKTTAKPSPARNSSAEGMLAFFEENAFRYDDEQDEWSTHYYRSIDELLRDEMIKIKPTSVLDVGVGSGNQLLLYASMGAEACGIDLARRMLRVAQYKIVQNRLRAGLLSADGQTLPFKENTFDFVACCGSVLNYCQSYSSALSEMSRVLSPQGSMLVGFDNSISLDYIWVLFNALTGNKLEYRITIGEAARWRSSLSPVVAYPYFTSDGCLHHVPERFIRPRDVASSLAQNGLIVKRFYGIHMLSGLIPFTLISNPKLTPWIRGMAHTLCGWDSSLRRLQGLNRFAYHVVTLAVKP